MVTIQKTKTVTREKAIRAMVLGADTSDYAAHANYHVRYAAWRRDGATIPDDIHERVDLARRIRPNAVAQLARVFSGLGAVFTLAIEWQASEERRLADELIKAMNVKLAATVA